MLTHISRQVSVITIILGASKHHLISFYKDNTNIADDLASNLITFHDEQAYFADYFGVKEYLKAKQNLARVKREFQLTSHSIQRGKPYGSFSIRRVKAFPTARLTSQTIQFSPR